jgi:hypothetical protein
VRKNIGKQFHLQLLQKLKYWGINLTKDVKDLYKKNYKPLIKLIKEDYKRWKELPCLWLVESILWKWLSIYMFNSISIEIPMTFITTIEKSTLKFFGKHKRQWIGKTILSKESNAGAITISDFKLYYRAITKPKPKQKTPSMVLAQKQIWRPMEQKRRPRYEPMQLCPPDFW